jgi:two-component system response regulator PhoP
MRILVVEDDETLREGLKQQLTETGFSVDVAQDGGEGLYAGLHYALDAAIVDIGLPVRSGFDVIREWRARERRFPVLVLTGRSSWQDKVEGLAAGADDYVGKPIRFEEVNARLRALTRRAKGWTSAELVCGPFVLNTHFRTAHIDGEAVDLTTFEYRLLEQLMLNAGQTLSRTELADHLYNEEVERESNIVTQLVYRLRKKLDPQDRINPIETVHRDGYRFAVTRGASAQAVVNRRRR